MSDDRQQELNMLTININFYFIQVANQRDYGSPESCVSYINSTIPKWKDEATAYSAWRDSCWVILMNMYNNLQPSDPIPTIDEVIALLPEMVWPNT